MREPMRGGGGLHDGVQLGAAPRQQSAARIWRLERQLRPQKTFMLRVGAADNCYNMFIFLCECAGDILILHIVKFILLECILHLYINEHC